LSASVWKRMNWSRASIMCGVHPSLDVADYRQPRPARSSKKAVLSTAFRRIGHAPRA
jgi:hypothetical protein